MHYFCVRIHSDRPLADDGHDDRSGAGDNDDDDGGSQKKKTQKSDDTEDWVIE